jgi:hypothetical protein
MLNEEIEELTGKPNNITTFFLMYTMRLAK